MASSSNRMRGLRITARAMAMRWTTHHTDTQQKRWEEDGQPGMTTSHAYTRLRSAPLLTEVLVVDD